MFCKQFGDISLCYRGITSMNVTGSYHSLGISHLQVLSPILSYNTNYTSKDPNLTNGNVFDNEKKKKVI